MLKKLFGKKLSNEELRIEEELYEIVGDELLRGEKRLGLWTKAISHANGDLGKTESLYIKFRVTSLIDELQQQQAEMASLAAKQKAGIDFKNRLKAQANAEATKALRESEEKAAWDKKVALIDSLKGEVKQHGEFELCCICGIANTRNKLDAHAVCNTCLKTYRL